MPVSSDVNVIFAYIDETDLFHIKVAIFIKPYKRKAPYILLDRVKGTFINRYSRYLKDACIFIEKAIMDYKAEKANSKRKPSPFLIKIVVEEYIKRQIEKEAIKKLNYNKNAIKRFVKKLSIEFSYITLYNEVDKLAEFRERYLVNAENEADYKITAFLKNFKNFHVLNEGEIKSIDEWLNKLKKIELDVFESKTDFEDMKIAVEFFGFNEEHEKLSFVTCDKEMARSLKVLIEYFKLNAGKIHLIKAPKKIN